MTGPGRPLEQRTSPRRGRARAARSSRRVASEVCGTDVHLHHGRLSGVPYPIIPGHVSCGRVLETAARSRDVEGRADRRPGTSSRSTTSSERAARAGTAWSRAPATRCPQPARLRDHDRRASEGLLGGWAEQIEILPGVRLVPLPDGLRRRRLHGRRLRPADRLPRGRARGRRAGRHRGRPGQRSRRSERGDLRAARRRAARPRRRRSRGAARSGARGSAPRTRSTSPRSPTPRPASAGCATGPRAAAPTS